MSETSTATRPSLYEATRRSLQSEPKELPPVWLYDERGSQLYEEITRLPDYYLPRREAEILRLARPPRSPADGGADARRARLREARRNTRFLLDALSATARSSALSRSTSASEMLRASAQAIAAAYPGSRSSRASATSSAI